MQFRTQRVEDAIVMMMEGRLLSEQEITPIRDQISHELNEGNCKIIFDLKSVDFVNSAFLNFLVSTRNMIAGKQGWMVLCNVPEQLKKLLGVTKLQSFFMMAGKTSDAVEMLRHS